LVDSTLNEQLTAERYVAGTLSAEEIARFEELMIERPELAADVNVRRRIKGGLALLEKRNELAPLLAAPSSRPQYLRYAAAASVLVVILGLWSTWRGGPAPPLQALFNAHEIGAAKGAASFMLVRTRSRDLPTYSVQRSAGPVLFRMLVDDPDAAPFAVHLVAGEKPSVAKPFNESSIAQATDGFAEIYLDPRELESGYYTLSLKTSSGAEQLYPFKLTVTP
jgi:hypothetical protein